MRTYEGETKLPPKNCRYKKFYTDGDTENYKIRPTGYFQRKMNAVRRGLKLIHIGEGVWRIGREKTLKDRRVHQVIYSPDAFEHHIYDSVVNSLRGRVSKDNNHADESLVKIYILTSILDDRSNWCFDLKIIPEFGRLKVIYSNGKVMNIDFNGEWLSYNTKKREFTHVFNNNYSVDFYDYEDRYELIHPVAYRITNHVV